MYKVDTMNVLGWTLLCRLDDHVHTGDVVWICYLLVIFIDC